MPEREFVEDLRVLVTAYLPVIESLSPVEQLVLAQCAVFIEMKDAHTEKAAREDDLN